uniref:Palmitoyltransferase n=1 Tax=Sinocyclocheilus grahami TaxID=75366 RepID=A0A672NBY8_SINGR
IITHPRRRWEVFPGKNRFCCDGRVMVARPPCSTINVFLIEALCGSSCPFLVKHLTSCIPAIGGVLFVFVIISLLQTSFTDPGILPRATPEEAADIEKQIDNPTGSSSSYRPPPRTKEVVINQQVVKLKYCFTCKIFRPPRTSHCSLCDNCVERFDHHCPWVGNCVGKRNYRFFYTFIISLSFLTAFIFGCVTTHLTLSTCRFILSVSVSSNKRIEHTPGAVGSHLCCGARGAVGGSVPCSRAPQSWYLRWRERCTFTPPTSNSC